MIQLNMLSILLRTNLISSLSRRYISKNTVKRMSNPLMYDLYNTLQQQKVSNLIKEFADELINMRGKCIDIGCGSGNITKHILLPAVDTNAVITGVDISESMIEYAKERYTVKNRLKFEVLDIQTEKLPTKYVSEFDHVFSFHVLHWCQDIRQAFENIYRMLRPNGTMLVNFPSSHVVFEILKNMIQNIHFAPYIPDVNKYIFPYHNSVNPHKELKKLLQNIGFTIFHCSLRDMYFLNENSNDEFAITEMNPAEYASFDSLQRDRVQYVVNEFAKDLRNISGKCMDIGCGPGDITSDILLSALDPNASIIGTDISENMIKYAKSMYGDKKLEFEVLDIQTKNLPVKYISKFDHIFSFHTLQWCSNIRQAFENIYRMLRPGGTMLISLIKSVDTIYKVFESMAQDIRFAPYMKSRKEYISPFNHSIRPHEELKDLLKNIGFHVHHCSNREMSTYDSDNLMRSVMAICLFLNEMPSNRKEEFKIDFARKYTDKKIELYGNKEDNIKDLTIVPVRYELMIAYAQKNAL